MLNRSTIALILLGTASIARAGIDLTPTISEYVAEGAKFQQFTFTHGKQRIEYEPPRTWSFEGGPTQLHLKPPKKDLADAVIEAVALSKPQPLDQNAVEILKQQFVASLPPGSQFVKVEQELQNLILLNGNYGFDITVSYQVMGQKFLRSALFVNLADAQLIFRFTARKDDFEPLQREFRQSLGSWHWVEPSPSGDRVATSAPAEQISQSH